MKILFFLLGLLSYSTVLNASAPRSFAQAKQIVYQIFSSHPKTLYCGCRFDSKHQIDLESCHMNSAVDKKRAHKVEIEHILATDMLGHNLSCWQNNICEHHGKPYKGRKCCEKMDGRFRQMESELYNLWPAVGLVNIARSNYSYGVVNTNGKFYGCDFKINRMTHEVEPSDNAKGIVARATLFMSDKYGVTLNDAKRALYTQWHKQYPPSKWEKDWASQIALIEGYNNPYILNQKD